MAWCKWTFAENETLEKAEMDSKLISGQIKLIDQVAKAFKDNKNHHRNELIKETVKALFENRELFISVSAFKKMDEMEKQNIHIWKDSASNHIKSIKAEKLVKESKKNGRLYDIYIPDRIKSDFVWEHVVPTAVMLAELKNNSFKDLKSKFGHVCIVTKEEDCRLNKLGLRDKMPEGWSDKVWSRYLAAKIEVMNVDETKPSIENMDVLTCNNCLSKDKNNQYKCKLIKGDIQSNDPMPCLNNKKVEE